MWKFTFTKETNHLLPQAVRKHEKHLAPYRKKDDAFDKARETIITNMSHVMPLHSQKTIIQTLRDMLRSLIANCRDANKRDDCTSEVEEVISPVEELLDKIMNEIDKMKKGKRRERKELTDQETALMGRGEQMQRNALSRSMWVDDGDTGSSRNTPRKRHLDDSDEWYKVFKRELSDKHDARN